MNCGQCARPGAVRVQVSDKEVRLLCFKCKQAHERVKYKYEVKYTKARDI